MHPIHENRLLKNSLRPNKKITLAIVVLAVIIIAFGITKGKKVYKEYNYTVKTEQTNTVEKNTETLPTKNVTKKETNTGKCIITIQGGHYDVTEFRTQHPGGDVFKCGTDMTAVFQGKHHGYLPMIAKFKVD